MKTFITLLIVGAFLFLLMLPFEIQRRRALQRFWERRCMGIRWRRRFPDALKTELREFLAIFVNAFCFDPKHRNCFSPDDQVMEVYRALYPPGSFTDSLELETLGLKLKKRYGLDLTTVWREDITLGELYEHTKRQAA